MRAFILAGGLGTRLRSIVDDRPKPLAPVGERPFLEYQLELLARRGISDVVLCVGYLGEQIERHLGDGGEFGMKLRYSHESQPLGTAGAIKNAERFIDGPFLMLNGDTYFDIDYAELIACHERERRDSHPALGTLAVVEMDDSRQYGRVRLDGRARVAEFLEKNPQHAGPGLVSAGVYVLSPAVLAHIPAGENHSLERTTFPSLIAPPSRLAACLAPGTFIDMGTPHGYYTLLHHLESREPCSSAAKPR